MLSGFGLGLGGLTPRQGVGGVAYAGPQIVLVGYGQSGWGNIMETGSSPDAAAAGTSYWDPASGAWVSAGLLAGTGGSAGNGIRKILNAIRAATGKTVGVVSYHKSGVAIAALLKGAGSGDPASGGTAYYDLGLYPQLVASGCRNASELWSLLQHGEGDANTASPNGTTYKTALDTVHGSIVGDIGKTRATCPMILSGIGRITATDGNYPFSDASWETIQAALITAHDTYPNIYHSHPNMDAALISLNDNHWDAASNGRSGERFARTLLALRGDVATRPRWFIAQVDKVDTTHIDVTVTHSMGTDFTPTSSISGFEVSLDGSSWIAATGARQSATVIRLTHSSLSASADRYVRYQYGKNPDNSAFVFDNGALTAPLMQTSSQLLVDYALPAMTSSATFSAAENQTVVGTLTVSRPSTLALGGTDAAKFQLVGAALSFITAPDYEIPGDSGANNVYDITITPTAIDNGDVGSAQSIAITVTDVAEGATSRQWAGSAYVISAGARGYSIPDAYVYEVPV